MSRTWMQEYSEMTPYQRTEAMLEKLLTGNENEDNAWHINKYVDPESFESLREEIRTTFNIWNYMAERYLVSSEVNPHMLRLEEITGNVILSIQYYDQVSGKIISEGRVKLVSEEPLLLVDLMYDYGVFDSYGNLVPNNYVEDTDPWE